MLEQLMQIVQQSSQEAVINNPEIPNNQNGAVMQEAGNALLTGIQQLLASGQASQVMGLFGSNPGITGLAASPLTQLVSNNFVEGISKRLGINPTIAKGIAAVLIPILISKFLNRTRTQAAPAESNNVNAGNDGNLDIQDIFNTLSGGRTGGLNIPEILGKFTQQRPTAAAGAQANPMDRDGDGDVDLQDLIGAFSGAQPQQGGFLEQLGRYMK